MPLLSAGELAAMRSEQSGTLPGTPVILSEVCGEAASLSVQKQIISEVNILLAAGEIVAALWFSSHLCNDWLSVPLTATTGSTTTLTALGSYWMANKVARKDIRT